jgi:PIN domain nuclease of toxin-antitoxin system
LIVLDTHVWFWWAGLPKKLSAAARAAIEAASSIGVSAVSCSELAMLALRARVELDVEIDVWIREALAADRVVALPLTDDIAIRAALLERAGFHGDPADRMIYATARAHDARLVTRDEAIREFDPAGTIW